MPPLVLVSIISMLLALILYSVGIWTVFLRKRIVAENLYEFVSGLFLDTTGTICMVFLAGELSENLHSLTGFMALGLMAINVIWAGVVLYQKRDSWFKVYRKFSLIIWIIWLIPFFSGMFLGMHK